MGAAVSTPVTLTIPKSKCLSVSVPRSRSRSWSANNRPRSGGVPRGPACWDTRAQWLRGRRGIVPRFLYNVSPARAQPPADARAVARRRLRGGPPTLAQSVSPACAAGLPRVYSQSPRVRSQSPPRAQPVSPACAAGLPRVRSPSPPRAQPVAPRGRGPLEPVRGRFSPSRPRPLRRPLAPPAHPSPSPPNDAAARFRRPAHATAPARCR